MKELDEKNFDAEVLDEKKVVLLWFTSKKYTEYGSMKDMIIDLERTNSDSIKILEVDVDRQFKLALKYQIFDVPAYVLMKYGIHQKRFSGSCTKEELLEFIK